MKAGWERCRRRDEGKERTLCRPEGKTKERMDEEKEVCVF